MERVVWFKIPKSSVVLSDQPITRGVETNDGKWEKQRCDRERLNSEEK
jgi:hypothetical protein